MNVTTELPKDTTTVPSGQSPKQSLAGLTERTRLVVEQLRSKPSVPPRILSFRATRDTVIQFGDIEAVLGDHGFNTTQIMEAAVKALHEKMVESGLIQKS